MWETKVRTVAGVKVVTIPKAITQLLELNDGKEMVWNVKGKQISLKEKSAPKREGV